MFMEGVWSVSVQHICTFVNVGVHRGCLGSLCLVGFRVYDYGFRLRHFRMFMDVRIGKWLHLETTCSFSVH